MSFFVPVSVPSGKCHAVSIGVLLACYSPVYRSPASPVATARIHSLMTDTFIAGSCMHYPVSECHFGFTTSHVSQGSCHMDASDTIIYMCQKVQTVLGKVSETRGNTVRDAAK